MSKINEHWICEYHGCSHVFVGVNPPDECSLCGHRYFENLQDLVDESDEATAEGARH